MSEEKKTPSFQDFVRAELGLGWVLAAALAVGLLVGSFGKLFQIPQEVYAFNRALEKEGLYDFFYREFMPDLRSKPPQLYTRAQAEKVKKVERILADHSPGFMLVMFMFLLGAALFIAFFLRLAAAYHVRIARLEDALAAQRSETNPSPPAAET